MAEQSTGDAKLVQYLVEAHGKETELIQALTEHIEIAQKDSYKKRLKDHLKETKNHAKLVERRVKKLGGDVDGGPVQKLVSAATKTPASAVKGVGHAIRGTDDIEKQLKNAKTEYFNEYEEIANYTAIEALATEIGDKETAKVAKQIRREEERMASFLEKQIPQLTKAVAKSIPKAERATNVKPTAPRPASSSRSTGGSKPKSASRSTGASKSASSRSKSRASSTTKSSSTAKRKAPAKRSTAKRSTTKK